MCLVFRRNVSRNDSSEVLESSTVAEGKEPLTKILRSRPLEVIEVGLPANPALDLHTYRVRHQRALSETGPITHGFGTFMEALEEPDRLLSAIAIPGRWTNYLLLLDPDLGRIVASVGIDHPDDWDSQPDPKQPTR